MGKHKRFLEEGKEEDHEELSESTSSQNDEGSESESESLSGDELEIERELADVPFEELQRARADGSHLSGPLKHKQSAIQKKPSRANKNRFHFSAVSFMWLIMVLVANFEILWV